MIEVKGITKKYGRYKAVDDISFTIEKGHIYGLLGPNGAGKSTTMNIITGYIAATKGTVLVDGYDVVKEPEKARKLIGYLPEIPPLYQDMTVYEYLMFAAELKKIKYKDRLVQVEEVIERMELSEKADKLIANLSKGYKQRVGFAQALLGHPEILIFDEPTVGLDPKQIIEMRELIMKLSKDATIILSSHIMQEISAVCDEILIINRGKLICKGTTKDLIGMSNYGGRLSVTIEGTKATLSKAFDKYDFIDDISITEEDNCAKADILLSKDAKDIRKELFNYFVDNKITLINMNYEDISLEEVFLELTSIEDDEDTKEDSVKEDSDESEDSIEDGKDTNDSEIETYEVENEEEE